VLTSRNIIIGNKRDVDDCAPSLASRIQAIVKPQFETAEGGRSTVSTKRFGACGWLPNCRGRSAWKSNGTRVISGTLGAVK